MRTNRPTPSRWVLIMSMMPSRLSNSTVTSTNTTRLVKRLAVRPMALDGVCMFVCQCTCTCETYGLCGVCWSYPTMLLWCLSPTLVTSLYVIYTKGPGQLSLVSSLEPAHSYILCLVKTRTDTLVFMEVQTLSFHVLTHTLTLTNTHTIVCRICTCGSANIMTTMAVETFSHSLTHIHMHNLVARFCTGSSATETIIAETHIRSHTLQHLTYAYAPQGAAQPSCLQLPRGHTLTYTQAHKCIDMHSWFSLTCTGGSATIMAATAVDLPRWLANRQTMVIAHIRTTHLHTSHTHTHKHAYNTHHAQTQTHANTHACTYAHMQSLLYCAYIHRQTQSQLNVANYFEKTSGYTRVLIHTHSRADTQTHTIVASQPF